MKFEAIKTIRKRFHRQWLLIKVGRLDEATTTPLTGHLLAHSPNRDLIFKKSLSYKGMIFVDYSEDTLPEGYAVAF